MGCVGFGVWGDMFGEWTDHHGAQVCCPLQGINAIIKCVCVHVCLRVQVCVCTVHNCICACVYMRVCECVCACIPVDICLYYGSVYVHTQTYH